MRLAEQWTVSVLAATADEQPAPVTIRGTGAPLGGRNPAEFVDMGTGEVEGDHDPFSKVDVGTVFLPSIVRVVSIRAQRIKGDG